MRFMDIEGLPSVALEFINQDHEAAAKLSHQIRHTLSQTPDNSEAIRRLLIDFLTLKKAHFEREEAVMLSVQDPDYHLHKQEHARLLSELRALADHWTKYQDADALKTYMHDIFPLWFATHVKTMDTAAANFACKMPRSSQQA